MRHVLEVLNSSQDPFTLICSESKSFNAERLDAATEKDMLQFLEDAYAFASSFAVQKKPYEADQHMTDHTGSKNLMLTNQASKLHTSSEELNELKEFAIDF